MEDTDRRLRIELSSQLLKKDLLGMSDRDVMRLQTELLNQANLSLACMVDLLQQISADLNSPRRAS